jgi:REP element-mobilizing transposase RayT
MGRSLRLLDTESGIVEVSSRTVQGRFLLRPSKEVNELILGVLGRAQSKYWVELYAFVFLSNHFHILMKASSAYRMSAFVGFLKANIAKELGRHHDWKEKFWGRRYHSASVADSALSDRFFYILSNGCKEGLLDSPLEWPGVSSTPALYRGESTMEGVWYDRTAEWRAHSSEGRTVYASVETVRLSPLPYLEGLSKKARTEYVRDAVCQVEAVTRSRHASEATQALGRRFIMQLRPHEKPKTFQRTAAPLFHAATREELEAMRAAREMIVAAYRAAASSVKMGEVGVSFPVGSFPPPPPFVETRAPPR